MTGGTKRGAWLALGGFLTVWAAAWGATRLGSGTGSGLEGVAFRVLLLAVPLLLSADPRPGTLGVAVRPVGPSLGWFAAFTALSLSALAFLYPAFAGSAWFPLPPYHPVLDGPALTRVAFVQLFAVAIPEEFFCRGFLQGRWAGARAWNVFGARLGWEWPAASAAFAMLHVPRAGAAGLWTLLPGLAFGWLYARTGRIWAGALYHASCNVAVIAMSGAA